MTITLAPHVLIVSSNQDASQKLFGLLANLNCVSSAAASCAEAKNRLCEESFDLIVILSPLVDGMGVELARKTVAAQHLMGCLVLVQKNMYDGACNTLSPNGILVMPKSTTTALVRQTLSFLLANRMKLLRYATQTERLQDQIHDVKTIARAKLLLMEHLQMGEAEAHHYIEKQAMDTCRHRRAVAEEILRTYQS